MRHNGQETVARRNTSRVLERERKNGLKSQTLCRMRAVKEGLIWYWIKVEERNFRSKMLLLTFSFLSENLRLSRGQLSDLQLDVQAAIHAPSRRTDCAVASQVRRQQDSRLNRPSLLTPLWQPCYNSLPESVALVQCVNLRLLSFILSAGKE